MPVFDSFPPPSATRRSIRAMKGVRSSGLTPCSAAIRSNAPRGRIALIASTIPRTRKALMGQ